MRHSINTVRKAFSLLDGAQRQSWAMLVPLAFMAAFLEAIAALLIFGLIGLMTDPSGANAIRAVAFVRSLLPDADTTTFVTIYGIFVGLFFVAKNSFRFLETYVRQRTANSTGLALSTRLLTDYLNAPYALHLRRNSAELIRNTHTSVDTVTRTVLVSGTAALSEALIVIGIMIVLAVAAPWGTLVAGLLAIGITLPLLKAMQSSYARWGSATHRLDETIQRRLQEAFRGIKEIKVLSGEKFFIRSFVEPRSRLATVVRWTDTLKIVPQLAVETFFVLAIVTVVIFAIRADLTGSELIALLGLIAYALMRLLPSLHLCIYHLNNCRFGEAAVDQIHDDLTASRASEKHVSARPPAFQFNNSVVLDNVGFRYPDTDETILRQINQTIEHGAFIGIVGPTGAGKSTLVDLLLGLHPPTEGRICVDGRDLSTMIGEWQSRIGYVSQHAFFIDDTLRRNIALGISDLDSNETRINRALEQAQLKSFVETLPDGLNTVIGEAGIRLSGGERQRLAIARAIYRDPDIIVFDEATSALDARTEQAVSDALETMRGDKTIIVIAHRLSTVQHCDRLLLVRDGQITDTGPFDELAERNAEFRQIAGLMDKS